jgi:hypothetical protein
MSNRVYTAPAILEHREVSFETTISKWHKHDDYDLGDFWKWIKKYKDKHDWDWWPW